VGGGSSSRFVTQKEAPKDKKKLTTQINGKFNDVSSADENITKCHCGALI
jgi:hypothetical protein